MTPHEVAQYTAIALPFNVCSFRQLLNIEYRQALELLGLELYDRMLAAKADYSTVEEWDRGGIYAEEELALWNGLYWVSLVSDNETEPGTSPQWEVAPKFDQGTECGAVYETVWCRHLAPYLASLILSQRLPFIGTKIMDVGVVKYNGADYATVTREEIVSLGTAIWRDVELTKDNLLRWIMAQDNIPCFGVFDIETGCFGNWEKREQQRQQNTLGAARRTPGGYDFG